jgi:DNA-binding NarL/FixJ family response regulator
MTKKIAPRHGAEWEAGFLAGVRAAARVVAEDYRIEPLSEAEREAKRRNPLAAARAEVMRRETARRRPSPAQASRNRLRRLMSDETLLPRVVELVRGGEVNKTIATELKIAVVSVKRIRAIAVQRGYLERRERH